MQSVKEGDNVPLYISPSEDVTADVDVTCKGLMMTSYTIQDDTVVLTIPSGTAAGKKLEVNCKFPTSFTNTEVSFLQGELPKGFTEDITILFVNKFAFNLTNDTYNFLEKNGKFPIQVYSTQEVSDDISIDNGTFYLKCTYLKSNIQLNNCDKITKISAKNFQNITCEVNEEIKTDDYCQLNIADGKKVDGVVPWVQTVYFGFENLEENSSSYSSDNSSESSDNSESFSDGEKLRISIGILVLLLLL